MPLSQASTACSHLLSDKALDNAGYSTLSNVKVTHNLLSGETGGHRCRFDRQVLVIDFDVTDLVPANPIWSPGRHDMLSNLVSIDTVSACIGPKDFLCAFPPVQLQ